MKWFLPILFLSLNVPVTAKDTRIDAEPITLNGYFPFRSMPEGKVDWELKQSAIRNRILVAAGLFPLPTKTPLDAVIHSEREFDGYTISKVYFQSMPGHFVSGSLYLPAKDARSEKMPGVLCPHGHWDDGRFYDLLEAKGDTAVRAMIAEGAERFESGARNAVQARCVQLARMGCAALVYDMLGEADSDQMVEHRRGPRPETNGREVGEWGFVSPMATAHLQTNFGLQTWNSVRALDFLTGLDFIDPDRVLVTGASGGATQTMVLAAIDDRVDAAFPAVMPSTAMQGGCTCENTHHLRIGQGNMDIAGAFAPKPLGITAADDWTIELREKGHPDMLALFKKLGASKNYEAHFDIHFKHNFNHVSRSHLYDFVNRHFALGFEAPVLERDFEYQGEVDLTVWDEAHPEPADVGVPHEKAVLKWWHEDAQKQFAKLSEGEASSVLETAVGVLVGRKMPGADEVEFVLGEKEDVGEAIRLSGIVRNLTHDEEIPVSFRFPKDDRWDGSVTIQLSGEGTSAAFDERGDSAVMGIDLFAGRNNDQATRPDQPAEATSWRRSPVYFYGYNHSAFARRVHDVMSCIAMAKNHPDWPVKEITLVASEAELPAIAACAGVLSGVTVETGDAAITFPVPDDQWDAAMIPGGKKYEALFR